MSLSPTFFDCAESALLVDFGSPYDKGMSLAILGLGDRLESSGLEGLRETVPALSSLLIIFDPLVLTRDRLVTEIEKLCEVPNEKLGKAQTWEIPVTYGGQRGPDLEELVRLTGLTAGQAISLHAEPLYHVYMLGFMPGFAYLGDLPDRLRLPRRSTPRSNVPSGSVAIASDLTAIYPLESPGGWHLIGWTPVALWDMARQQEPLLRPGDQVRFKPISSAEAEKLCARVEAGWTPEPVEAA